VTYFYVACGHYLRMPFRCSNTPFSEMRAYSASILIRRFRRRVSPHYWFDVCNKDKSFTLQEEHKRVRRDLWPSQRIRQAVFAVQQALQQQALNGSGEYISVHVRRSDKIGSCRHHIKEDTSARNILDKLLSFQADQKLQTNIPVYIASDERSAGYFDELLLSDQLNAFTAANFSGVLDFTTGNNYLLFKVEMALHSLASQKVETFKDDGDLYLTEDPKHCGYHVNP